MDGIYIIISALIGASATIASVLLSQRIKKKKKDPIIDEHKNSENIYTALNFVMEESCTKGTTGVITLHYM